MLNAKKLSDLLAKNVDPRLYPRMFVMSPNGTLLAYSTPANIKELRDQAALVSMAWKENETAIDAKQDDDHDEPPQQLETLTVEFDNNNLIVRAIQPKLLLVLVGGVPPGRKLPFKVTPEVHGSARYPTAPAVQSAEDASEADSTKDLSEGIGSPRAPSIAASNMSQRERDMKMGALHIQRKKLDALTRFIRRDFDAKGFVMPDDVSFP
ncbi:hypothetical protein K490DRAFT_31034 [Saccharata proteae CBS 121410]|uniref:Uncharacterized protein n=1 Tax=Saccharata proteae CBS 121410 TaxID=1314787 RepID=A0A9P4M083_9PEZI|nr:hypothetical protein K490DRAFT_31034 [Saccharata proteae CBS 121410]